MIVDGSQIADVIYSELKTRVEELQKREIIPTLAIILVGDNPASKAYIAQKEQKAKNVGAQIELFTYNNDVITSTLLDKVRELNANEQIHGIIVQRPLPPQINHDVIQEAIDDKKDVDGFKPGSPFQVPLVMAVMRILDNVYKFETNSQDKNNAVNLDIRHSDFFTWLKQKNTVLLGKGSTSGQPLVDYMKEIGQPYTLIDSQTPTPEAITKTADIIISSVGKPDIVKPEMIKKDVILISVGLSKDDQGKMHGDYEEEEIASIASYYTPTPKGVGPVNVAMLLHNLVTATEQLS